MTARHCERRGHRTELFAAGLRRFSPSSVSRLMAGLSPIAVAKRSSRLVMGAPVKVLMARQRRAAAIALSTSLRSIRCVRHEFSTSCIAKGLSICNRRWPAIPRRDGDHRFKTHTWCARFEPRRSPKIVLTDQRTRHSSAANTSGDHDEARMSHVNQGTVAV